MKEKVQVITFYKKKGVDAGFKKIKKTDVSVVATGFFSLGKLINVIMDVI